ncbi:MAG: hypothetical protein Q7S52_05155 [bacterium]|nr:hypothetical protein [bacterium]
MPPLQSLSFAFVCAIVLTVSGCDKQLKLPVEVEQQMRSSTNGLLPCVQRSQEYAGFVQETTKLFRLSENDARELMQSRPYLIGFQPLPPKTVKEVIVVYAAFYPGGQMVGKFYLIFRDEKGYCNAGSADTRGEIFRAQSAVAQKVMKKLENKYSPYQAVRD